MKQNDQMHVVHIITKLEMGGAQKVCLTIKKGLDSHNIWASLISGDSGELVKSARQLPNSIFIKELKREVSILGIFNELVCFFKLIQHVRRLKKQYPDLIVHTHSTKAGLMGRWASFFAGVKRRVHTIHGYGFQPEQNLFIRFWIYFLELMTSIITTHYICVSTEDAKRGIRIFPGFAKKHCIIRAAIDWQQFYRPARRIFPVTSNNNLYVFGTVGGLSKRKNQIEILKAFGSGTRQISTYTIRNNRRRRSTINTSSWVSENRLENAVIFHGWQHNVAPTMANWQAFLLSSLWEGMPCVIVEARMLNLPVLSYETNGISMLLFQVLTDLFISNEIMMALHRA